MKRYLCLILLPFMLIMCSKKEEHSPSANEQNQESIILSEPSSPAPAVSPDKILSPIDSIKELDQKVQKYKTGPNLIPDQIQENQKLKLEILRGTFDVQTLSRLALANHWEPLSEADRNYFVNLMMSLLENKAVFSKEHVKEEKPYQVNYKSQKFLDDKKEKAEVLTQLSVPSKKVTLNISYNLNFTPSGWKIYDVMVDGASLVENYKFQFDTIIKKYGYSDLVARMEKKLKEIRQE